MTETAPTKPSTWTPELVFSLLAITAQALITVELFAPASIPGKLVSVVGIVLTGLGYSVARAKSARAALPVSLVCVAVCIGISVTASGCTKAQLKDAGTRAATSMVDCMQPALVSTALELKPTYRELLELATGGDGKVDREALKSAAAGLKTPALRCAFSTVVAEAMHAVTNATSEVQSAPLEVDKEDLAATFEAIRAESFAGERYKLESGVL